MAILLASLALTGCVVTAAESGGTYYERPYAYYGPPHRHRHYHGPRYYSYAPGFYPGRPVYCRPGYFGPPRCFYR
jgi:hypothetical protein